MNIDGKYSRSLMYGVYEELILNHDQSFEFNWTRGLNKGTTKGIWKYKNNVLTLHSHKQPKLYKNAINYITFEEEDSIEIYQIKIIDSNYNEPVMYANCAVSSKSQITSASFTDLEGTCRLQYHANDDTLKISHIGYDKIEISTNNLKSKKMVLNIEESEPFHWYFTNEQLNVTSKGILDNKERKIGKVYFKKCRK